MVFGFNKNKREVIDLRNKDSGGIPSDGYLKRKSGMPGGSSIVNPSITTSADFPSANISDSSNFSTVGTSSSSNSGGGFFSFFGNNDSSSNNSNTSPGYGANGNSSSTSSSEINKDAVDKVESRLNDLLYRFSRLMDRVELLEKKMDRLDRRNSAE